MSVEPKEVILGLLYGDFKELPTFLTLHITIKTLITPSPTLQGLEGLKINKCKTSPSFFLFYGSTELGHGQVT